MMVHNDKSIVHYEGWSRIDFHKPEMDMESLRGFDHAHLACELPTSSDDRSAPGRAFQWADLRGYLQETKVYAPN
jgi:hypothetical protein